MAPRPSPPREALSAVPPSPKRRLAAGALVLAVIAGCFLAVFYPAAKARFALVDDHEILRFASPAPVHPDLTDHFGPIHSVLFITFARDIRRGRFRPVYYLTRFAQVALLKTNPAAWHWVRLAAGILTCFLLYLAGRRLGLSVAAAGLLVAWTALQEGSTEIWVRLGPSETQAMLFFALALLAITRAAGARKPGRWDAAALGSLALMGWSKETFVLAIPALLLTRLGLEWRRHPEGWRRSARAAAVPLVAGAVLFAGQFAMVLWLYLRGGYGGHVLQSVHRPYSPVAWAAILGGVAGRFSYDLPLGFGALWLLSALFRRRRVSRYGLAVAWGRAWCCWFPRPSPRGSMPRTSPLGRGCSIAWCARWPGR